MRTLFWSAALGCALANGACAGNVSGAVEGEGVPSFLSGLYVSGNINVNTFGFRDVDFDQIALTFVSFYGACDFFAADYEIINKESGADEAEARAELYRARAPEDWWRLDVSIVADDESDVDGEQLKPGEANDDKRLGVTLCHVEGFPEEDNGFLDVDEDCYDATDGELEIALAEDEGASLRGELELQERGSSSGDDTVELSASASWCEPADEEFEDLIR